MRILFIVFISFSALVLSSCEHKKKIDPKLDDSLYEKLDAGFFKGKTDGKLYIKTGTLEKGKDSSNKIVFYYKHVPDVDVASFTKLPFGGYYVKDKNQVYIWDITSTGEDIVPFKQADPQSFTAIANRWGKDKDAVYFENKVVKGLDPNEMVVVCANTEDSSSIFIDYIRDNDQLFYHDTEVKVPSDIDIQKLTCKEDLFGNPFLSFNEKLYIIRNGSMVLYQ